MPYGPDPAHLARLDAATRRRLVRLWQVFALGAGLAAIGGMSALVLGGGAARIGAYALGVGVLLLLAAFVGARRMGLRVEPGPVEQDGAAPPAESGPDAVGPGDKD